MQKQSISVRGVSLGNDLAIKLKDPALIEYNRIFVKSFVLVQFQFRKTYRRHYEK
jgi:hypothetical protein